MYNNIIHFLIGCILLYYGAEFLVRGSKTIAEKFNIPSIIVGITIVALGTSLPELFVSILANLKNQQGMVIGNVMGSNITNIGLVLGITAIIGEVKFPFSKIRTDLYFFLGISFLPLLFIMMGGLVLWQGLVLILVLIIYCIFLINNDKIDDLEKKPQVYNKVLFLQVIFGMIGLSVGATLFIKGATQIAIYLGVSDLVIGMSIVALGTSLPELAASLASVKHGEDAFVIGNIIGSNIINIVFVLGVALLFGDIWVSFNQINIQGFFMVLLTLGVFVLIKLKDNINKYFGIIFLIIYILFIYLNFSNA